MKVAVSTSEATLNEWLALVGLTDAPIDSRLLAAVTDLIESIDDRPGVAHSALHRFGYTLGSDGWPIAQVSAWLLALTACVGRSQRKVLGHYRSHSSAAQGWADGFVRGAHADQCIDPATGLVTAMVLRLDLLERYQHAGDVAEALAALHVLVVVDVDVYGLAGLDADLRMATVADAVTTVFHHGDTVARVGSRVVVLASNTEHTEQRTAVLIDRLRFNPSIRAARATVVLDELPASASLIDGYLRDLAG
jgi:hypothetical protein